MGSISDHIMPLVINSLGAGTHTLVQMFADKAILRNQVFNNLTYVCKQATIQNANRKVNKAVNLQTLCMCS